MMPTRSPGDLLRRSGLIVVRGGFAPQEDPALADDPLGKLTATLGDGKQLVHKQVLEHVVQAVVE